MMNGFFISITNNLLEEKHYENMGNAIWLYMWLIDRMTDISEGQGIVNHGHPVTFEMIQKNFGDMTDRTYRNWVKRLRDTGYINTVQAKYGLFITINKAKKNFNKKAQSSPANNFLAESKTAIQPGKKVPPARKKVSVSPEKDFLALNKNTNTTTNTTNINNRTKATMSPEHAEISKLFYEAIKALKLPVTNHTVIKAKIKVLVLEDEHQKIVNYLTFIRDQYETVDWSYKPAINTALDIYTKRLSIRNTFVKEVKDQTKQQAKVLRI